MNRVATLPVQYTMTNAIQGTQSKLATSLEQLQTGKKANDYKELGLDTTRVLSARSMLARQAAQDSVSSQVGTQLEYYNTSLTAMEKDATDLRKSLTEAIGSGDASGLQSGVEQAFASLRSLFNTAVAGQPIYAGSQTGSAPFTPKTLDDLKTVNLGTPDNAFINDQVKASAQVSDDINMQYGITASDVGTNLTKALQTLADAGPFDGKPTDAQVAAMKQAIDQLGAGIHDVQTASANNGRLQQQIDTLQARGEDRTVMLKTVIGDAEDADMGQVATDIINNQTMLQASYSVFSRISGLNLSNFLK